jgi:hypothetical protein
MMWDNDIERAKDAIRRGDYEKARTILEMMPDNHIARNLLGKLNRKNLKFRHETSQDIPPVIIQNIVNTSNQSGVPTVAFIIIVLNMLFWAFLIIGTVAFNAFTAQYQAITVMGVILSFGILLLLYYLFWRFYWWMLALSWLLASCAVVVALSLGAQLLIPLQ